MRSGIGYDVHAFGAGRRLIIGGVDIPYESGLVGHSDADVLAHAVMDSLLGAAALGDIGGYFPDNDEKYHNISSLRLLAEVGRILRKSAFYIVNIDSVIVAQEPKLAPYIETMRANIAAALSVNIDQVSVKATTEEYLGFTGEKRGIKALATCMIEADTTTAMRGGK